MPWTSKLSGTLFSLVVVVGTGISSNAFASVILTTGQPAVFDFDLSGLSPPPPYTVLQFVLNFAAGDQFESGETILVEVFDTDGAPAVGTSSFEATISMTVAFASFVDFPTAAVADGLGLLVLSMLAGTVDLTRVQVALQLSGRLGTPRRDAVLRPVPEPPPVAMLVVGLAWLAYLRRRRKLHAPM